MGRLVERGYAGRPVAGRREGVGPVADRWFGEWVFLVVTCAVPVQILSPRLSADAFNFGFNTISNRTHTVQFTTNLASPNWTLLTNFIGTGSLTFLVTPVTNATQRFFRVSEP